MDTLKYRNTIPFTYGFLTVLFILIICIYEQFSHGVTSLYMRGTPLLILVGGFLPSIFTRTAQIPIFLRYMYRCALATLILYSFMQGVLEIYGTTSSYMSIYLIVSLLLFTSTLIFAIAYFIYSKVVQRHSLKK